MNIPLLNEVITGLGIFFFLIFNALLNACETSLVKIRYTVIDQKDLDQIRSRKNHRRIIDRSEEIASVIRFSIILNIMFFGFILFPFFQTIMADFSDLGLQEYRYLWTGMFFILIVSIFFIFGELLPRAFSWAFPEKSLAITASFIHILAIFAMPFIKVNQWCAKKIGHFVNLSDKTNMHLLDMVIQVRALGSNKVATSWLTRKILLNTLRFRELDLSDVLVPRNQVQYLDANHSLEENLARAQESGHTRFPLCEGDLDNCIGLIHIKDLFLHQGAPQKINLSAIRRTILSLPVDTPLESALEKLLHQKCHMALVTDEFGGSVGVITLENLLEELVGAIQDEFDSEEELIQKIAENQFKVLGSTPVHEIETFFHVKIPNNTVSTFSGLIIAEIGRIPRKHELLSIVNLEIKILEVDKKCILSTYVSFHPSEASNSLPVESS